MHIEQAMSTNLKEQGILEQQLLTINKEQVNIESQVKNIKEGMMATLLNEINLGEQRVRQAQIEAALKNTLLEGERQKIQLALSINQQQLQQTASRLQQLSIEKAELSAIRYIESARFEQQLTYFNNQLKISNYRQRDNQLTKAAIRDLKTKETDIEATRAASFKTEVARLVFKSEMIGERQKKLSQELILEQKLLEMDTQAILVMEGLAQAHTRINELSQEEINTMIQLGILRDDMHLLSQQEIQDLLNLMQAEQDLMLVKDSAQMQRLEESIAMRQNLFGMKNQDAAMKRMTGTLGKLSMAAGIASMAVGVLGGVMGMDEEKSARVQIILMTLSMIPATIQMAAMSQQMLGTATSGQVMSWSAFKASLSFNSLATSLATARTAMVGFISACLPLLAITAVVMAIAFAVEKFTSNATKTTDTLDGMNTSLKITTDLLGALTEESAKAFEVPAALADEFGTQVDLTTMSIADMNTHLSISTGLLAEYAENQALYGKDDPMYHHWQNRTNDLVAYNEALNQNKLILTGQELMNTERGSGKYFSELIQHFADGDFGKLEAPPFEDSVGKDMADGWIKTGNKFMMGKKGGWYGLGKDTESRMSDSIFGVKQETMDDVIAGLIDGSILITDLSEEALQFFLNIGKGAENAAKDFDYLNPRILETGQDMGDGFTEAEEKMRSFANAREELFFGGRSQYMTGEMMKQVVNKGVENLYSNVELLMTNNFFGLTMDEAINEISSKVTRQLIEQGVPLNQ